MIKQTSNIEKNMEIQLWIILFFIRYHSGLSITEFIIGGGALKEQVQHQLEIAEEVVKLYFDGYDIKTSLAIAKKIFKQE